MDPLDESGTALCGNISHPPRIPSRHWPASTRSSTNIVTRVVVGGGKLPHYSHSVLHLDVMIDYARRQNDVAFLRRYVRAVEFVGKGKHRALDATAQALVAWRQLRKSLGKAPSPQEVKLQVEKEIGFKFTDRQWRRVFQNLAELFEPAG